MWSYLTQNFQKPWKMENSKWKQEIFLCIGQIELHMMVHSLVFVMHVPDSSNASVFKIVSPSVSDSTVTEEEHLQWRSHMQDEQLYDHKVKCDLPPELSHSHPSLQYFLVSQQCPRQCTRSAKQSCNIALLNYRYIAVNASVQ